jgi:group II intron reverse transcriptase/maturase
MRRRSFHSSAFSCAKGNSITSPEVETLDNNLEKPANQVKPSKVVKRVGVTTMVRKLLEQNKVAGQKYYKILQVIAEPNFLAACYDEIKSQGNMTRGVDRVTLDGIDYKWFEKVAMDLKSGKFDFKPNRRVEIPKANGRTRPNGIGSPREKIVQKALHSVLEAIFEPQFLDTSHGFRPNKSTHSALFITYLIGNKHNWVIQGDITKCFYSIPHSIIMKRIRAQIGDPAFLSIIRKFLNAGFIDPTTGKLVNSYSGTPQGGILSPLLSNIVLHELDKYLAKYKVSFTKGRKRR